MEEEQSEALSDPRAMRALAHPVRLRLLSELRIRGPQTVGTLSEATDEPVGSVSYHLGKLASHGFVEEVPEMARNRRERWWRASRARTVWKPLSALEDPERQAATNLLRRAILQRYAEMLDGYLDSEAFLEPEWTSAAISGDTLLHLTSGDLLELRGELEELSARWEARGSEDRPGAHPVSLIFHAFRRP
ncbi:helix-turn-helix domain-containing protein [Streptosporangium sp. NPDC023615]|uniref:ArsR/SmtB family transcription factor n=1 Tax=Streptosporangium sp. NPDC023615 TaxID=3154794 RepID=UPI00343D6066